MDIADAFRRPGIRLSVVQWLSEDGCGIRDACALMMSCEAGHGVSLSEGNAKTSLEQSPVRELPRPMGLHKSTVTTQRNSV